MSVRLVLRCAREGGRGGGEVSCPSLSSPAEVMSDTTEGEGRDSPPQTETETERQSFESDGLSCYSERLAVDSCTDTQTDSQVKFSEEVTVCPTYTSQEYDREPRENWREKERQVEETVEKLDILVLELNTREVISHVVFTDFHKMINLQEEEEEEEESDVNVICDFGVYVESVEEEFEIPLKRGDLVLCLNNQVYLEKVL